MAARFSYQLYSARNHPPLPDLRQEILRYDND